MRMTTGDPPAWDLAERAVVAGDVSTLSRLLREHEQIFRTHRPGSSWLGGLTTDYSATDAHAIIVRAHGFDSWNQFLAYAGAKSNPTSPVAQFEAAVDTVVSGDVTGLQQSL